MTNLSLVSKAVAFIGIAAALIVFTIIGGARESSAGFYALVASVTFLALALYTLIVTQHLLDKILNVIINAANGDLGMRLLRPRGGGKLSEMQVFTNRLLDQMEAFSKETSAAMRAAYNKKFYRKIVERGLRGEFLRYASNVNDTLNVMKENQKRLQDFEVRVLDDAIHVSMAVNEGAIANATFVKNVQATSRETQEMAAATQEIVAGIENITETSASTKTISNQAHGITDEARRGMSQAITEFTEVENTVHEAAQRVTALAAASEAIADILSTIEQIASQTNLLALNATIEAARAGDAGKGFAVVAGEVKNLSGQTAKATEDISVRITNLKTEMTAIVNAMRRSTDAISKGRTTMQSMDERMGDVSRMVADTSARVGEISSTITEQAAATNQISSSVQRIALQSHNNNEAVEVSTRTLMDVEQEMANLLTMLAERELPNKVLMLAKADHIIWKKRIVDILSGRVTVTPDQLSNETTCRLGKWYNSEEAAQYRKDPAFIELATPHRAVHQNGLKAVELYNSGQFDAAMECYKMLDEASKNVILCLDQVLKNCEKQAS